MKKLITLFFTLSVFSTSIFALDLTLRLNPGVFIPVATEDFATGFGGFAQADIDLFGIATAGVEGELSYPQFKDESLPDFIPVGGGIGVGAYFSPFSRLYLGAGGAVGIDTYSSLKNRSNKDDDSEDVHDDDQEKSDATPMGYYWRGYGEIGFRITPEVTVSAVGSYIDHRFTTGSFLKGINAGIGLKYVVPLSKKSSSTFGLSFDQQDSAFPLFMSAYRNFELGTLTIRNNESSEIRNVHVSFRAGKYTASTYESANIPYVNKHSSIEVPLLADFSTEVLKYSENGKINGEVIVDYELLGKKKQSIQNVVIGMYNRNAFYWSDPAALAAFISSSTPEVQQLASIFSGIETNNLIQGMNKSIQMAAAVYEGLKLSGIKFSDDKTTPYVDFHKTYNLDSVQYPLQTMNYLSGDMDDIGILLASCLESVGVPTGYLILDDDFIVLVGTNIRAGTEKNHYQNVDGLIVDDENVYFGLSMAEFQNGFAKSRRVASDKIAAAKLDENASIDYVGTHAAWEIYPSAVFSGTGSNFETPSKDAIEKATKAAIEDYINTDLAYVVEQAKATGDSNKLGVAYLRSGKVKEAKAEFSKVDSISCMNNLASCYMAEKDYTAAAAQYKKVLEKAPDNKIALRGLDTANEKLGL